MTARDATAVLMELATRSDRPWSAMVELADRCNESCIHCYQVQGQKGEMTTDQAKSVLDELAEMGVLTLTLSGGEVTLRSDFLELVEHARRAGFAVKIFTNGLTMTDSLAQQLGRLGVLEVQISLYSPRARVHDWVTKVPGSFEAATTAVRRLVAANVHVVIKTPLMSVNADDLDDYRNLARGLGADFMFDPDLVPREDGVRDPEALRIDDDQLARMTSEPSFGLKPGDASLDRRPCGVCSSGVVIEANGEVRPCAQLAVGLGDATREGIAQSWNSGLAEDLRSVRWGDLHGCRECDIRAHCSRCFATARTQTGDALAPYESACRNARARYRAAHGSLELEADGGESREVGPYRELEPGRLRVFEAQFTERDQELRTRNRWAVADGSPEPAERARPGQLVQLRRPGRKSRVERVPELSS